MTDYYRNEMLFSEIYLEAITRQPEHADVLASLKVLREYRAYADTSNLVAWKKTYVHEVLAALGFNVTVKNAGLTLLYPMGSVEQPVSICFVTLPDESLDNTLMGRNWAEKTIRALRQQGLQWGLLTNGKLWRIYHLDESTPYETYLEIDLENILDDQAKDAYQIFHKFMKSDNFVVGDDAKCQFDRFKKDSKDKIDYIQKELANALKQREEGGKGVLSDLCMGYVEEIRTRGESDLDDETLRRKVYHGAMLYMFRLLFLFYADTRGLLSDANGILLSEVEADARTLHNGEKDKDDQYSIWDRLSAIFVDIDQTYNGGLFSPQESEFTQFIEETRCADRYLAETLFNLTTYHEKNGQEHPISYRDMSVRHLGTLYEGLLEHKLFITKEDTEVRVTKGKIEFIPVSHGGKLLPGHYLVTGAVYFGSDPSERKSTGSYYTPEYIVDNIVRNTVGEKLKELKADFLAQEKENLDGLARAVDEFERAALASLLEENALSFVRQKILSLSVLDPAMGSGHFLVNVTNLIANFITEFLNELGIEGETPTGTAYWRRWVVENCIYGVDLNPLAVELAKLSLWILSMAKDQPLSFMNHHLKCGNSLVGARLEEIGNYPFSTVQKEPRQINMFERDPNFRAAVEDAIAKSKMIAAHSSTTLEDVDEKKIWLAETEQDLRGYKAICDVHIGLYFGNLIEEKQYTDLVEKRDFSKALALRNNQFFHWRLEFPEQFFLGKEGFDIVIGNPPYSSKKTIENKILMNFFRLIEYKCDTFAFFIEQGLDVLKPSGALGIIIPSSWMTNIYYSKIRSELVQSRSLRKVVMIDDLVFKDANIDTSLVFLNKHSIKDGVFSWIRGTSENLEKEHTDRYYKDIALNPGYDITPGADADWQLIKQKIDSASVRLDMLGKVSLGMKLRSNDLFVTDIQSEKHPDPIIFGRDISRYGDITLAHFFNFKEADIIGGTKRPEIHRASPKIFIQSIRNLSLKRRIVATLDNIGYCFVGTVNSFILREIDYDIRYILGILNSKLMNTYFSQRFTTISLTAAFLGPMPIKKINFTDKSEVEKYQKIINLVDDILQITKSPKGDPDLSQKQHLLKLDNEIESAVYSLYGLTSEEEIYFSKNDIQDW